MIGTTSEAIAVATMKRFMLFILDPPGAAAFDKCDALAMNLN
ncbi:MAG: hypothetical protein ACK4FB_11060 [Brevundimonas sp.]